jgi:CheY-like chemotaxis protein
VSTRKLLLADDSITIQKVVNLTFADEGIEVIAVGSGDAAMEKMAEISPDLVMADINMPGLTGYQVCERIKQDENYREIPVILLVGSFEPFDEEEARRVGADDFLTKPFQSIRQLVNKVTVLLDANDHSAAQSYEATANNSFADTLEMNKSEITDSDKANDLGDAGMDDEMIQANSVSNFALDESAKFETKDFASYEDAEDYKKTQPLSVYDLKEFSFVADSTEKENESQSSDNSYLSESEQQDLQSFNENNFIQTEPHQFADNKTDEDVSPAQDFVENSTSETQPDVQNFYESVLEENAPENKKKENFSAFLDSSDDDLLEIPFDEDEEWETTKTAEELENNSAESTEPTSVTDESWQHSQDKVSAEEKTEKSFAEQDQITEEDSQGAISESEEQEDSLIEELPQPETFENTQEETPIQGFYESEESASQEVSEENSQVEFNDEIQRQESDEKNLAEDNDEALSPEVTEEISQEEMAENEDNQPKHAELQENYHSEDEIIVGSLLEPENKESESINEAKNTENLTENQHSAESAMQFSPEVIDAIARRVVEMLSDKVVREIAWEVVPQHADLVIKKAVEEKLAEETLKE